MSYREVATRFRVRLGQFKNIYREGLSLSGIEDLHQSGWKRKQPLHYLWLLRPKVLTFCLCFSLTVQAHRGSLGTALQVSSFWDWKSILIFISTQTNCGIAKCIWNPGEYQHQQVNAQSTHTSAHFSPRRRHVATPSIKRAKTSTFSHGCCTVRFWLVHRGCSSAVGKWRGGVTV